MKQPPLYTYIEISTVREIFAAEANFVCTKKISPAGGLTRKLYRVIPCPKFLGNEATSFSVKCWLAKTRAAPSQFYTLQTVTWPDEFGHTHTLMIHLHGATRFLCKGARLACFPHVFQLPFAPKRLVGCAHRVLVDDGFCAYVYDALGLVDVFRSPGRALLGADWYGYTDHNVFYKTREGKTTTNKLPFKQGYYCTDSGNGTYVLYECGGNHQFCNVALILRDGSVRMALFHRAIISACINDHFVFFATARSVIKLDIHGSLNLNAMDKDECECKTICARDGIYTDGPRLLLKACEYTLLDASRMIVLATFKYPLRLLAFRGNRIAWLDGTRICIEPWHARADANLLKQQERKARERTVGILDHDYTLLYIQVVQANQLPMTPSLERLLMGRKFSLTPLSCSVSAPPATASI